MKYSFILPFLYAFLFYACETKIDPCDEWQNIPIVYGILDPDDSVHYIRLNRAFLGNINAYEMASESDSLIYNYDVDVQVHVLNSNGQVVTTLHFEKTPMVKDSFNIAGQSVFGLQNHHVYVSRSTIPSDQKYTYRLEINFPNGQSVFSLTSSVRNFRHFMPSTLNEVEITNRVGNNFRIEFYMPEDNGVAKTEIRVYYYEVLYSGDIKKKWVSFGDYFYRIFESEYNPKLLSVKILDKEIIKRFRRALDSTNQNVIARYIGNLEVLYGVGNLDLTDVLFYRMSTLNTEIQSPTNITGGYGFFASRRHLTKKFRNSEVSFETFHVFLSNHKFQPRGAYIDFFQNLPDSLQ